MATKLAPYSQLGFVITPRNLGIISGDLPEYGPETISLLSTSNQTIFYLNTLSSGHNHWHVHCPISQEDAVILKLCPPGN